MSMESESGEMTTDGTDWTDSRGSWSVRIRLIRQIRGLFLIQTSP